MKCLLILLALSVTSAYGMVYSWTDSAGTMHYTNKEYEIPARYRARVKARFPEATDMAAPQQNPQTTTVQPETLPPARVTQPVPQAPVMTSGAPDSAPRQGARRVRRARNATSREE